MNGGIVVVIPSEFRAQTTNYLNYCSRRAPAVLRGDPYNKTLFIVTTRLSLMV